MCVLVVEDDATLGAVFVQTLKKLGQNGELVTSGEEAIERFKNAEYALVLMDIGLPGKDGLEVTRELKKLGSDTAIVAVTAGYASPAQCKQAGMDDYYVKPVMFDQLQKIVSKWSHGPCKR